MDISISNQELIAFGRFRLDPQRRLLMHDGEAVKLTPKAFDTLLHLVSNAGQLVGKDELMCAVWGQRIVEEGNLTQAIFSIRKALQREPGADRWIVTAPGRGYRFTADVTRDAGAGYQPAYAPMTASSGGALAAAGDARRGRPRRLMIAAMFCVALAAGGTLLWQRIGQRVATGGGGAAFAPPPGSVAVLAFANMSGNPAQEYLSDGLADELINTLSRIGGLQVAARTSAFSFKDRHATIGDIARALNVGAIVEGSVARDGAQLRVNVQLINAVTGFPFWSRTYDHDFGNVMTSQAEIAAAVAESLRVKLLDQDRTRLTTGGTGNPAALDAYLRGVESLREQQPKAALAQFDTALGLDPRYALARVRRSQSLRNIVNADDDGDAARTARLEDEAIAEAERAVALAPDLGAAHAVLGVALEEGRFDFRRASIEIDRARDLAPGDALTNTYFAGLQSHLGHADEAVAAAAFGTTLDPLSPRIFISQAGILAFARRYPQAVRAARHAAEVRGHATPYDSYLIGEIQFLQGEPAASLASCGGDFWLLRHCQALAYHALGRQQEADAALAKLRAAIGDGGAMNYAAIYAQWGDQAQAIAWLETAYRLRDPGLIEMQVLPLLDPIRGAPAFLDIQHRMDFPP